MAAKIYEPKGKAREYSPLALNYYKGCSHACKYCYVPNIFARFGNYDHAKIEFDKKQILHDVELSARKFAGTEKQVLLSFTSDPYQEVEGELGITREVLKTLFKYNIPVNVLTKNPLLALRDLDILKPYDKVAIGTTLTFFDEKKSKEWESGAPTSINRLRALWKLRQEGIITWASFEPVIEPDESLKLLKLGAENQCFDYVKIGKLNNYKGLDKKIDWYSFLKKAVSICREYNLNFYVKKDLAAFKKDIYLQKEELNADYLTVQTFAASSVGD